MSKDVFYMFTENTGEFTGVERELAESYLNDPKNKNKGLKTNMILQETEVMNKNKRLYSRQPLVNAMKAYEYKIKRGHSLMESGHPITKDPLRFNSVVMANSVARINSYKWNGNILEAETETLNTTIGRDYRDMLLQEGFVGATSLRATGTVTKGFRNQVKRVNKVNIIAYDIVLNPSHENAVVQNLITESEVQNMILNMSDNINILRETLYTELGYEPDIFTENTTEVGYNLNENSVMLCNGQGCMKVMLEEHIRTRYKRLCDKSFFSR